MAFQKQTIQPSSFSVAACAAGLYGFNLILGYATAAHVFPGGGVFGATFAAALGLFTLLLSVAVFLAANPLPALVVSIGVTAVVGATVTVTTRQPVLIMGASFLAEMLALVLAMALFARPHDFSRCGNCGYSLEGLTSGICPECGRQP